MPFLGWLSSRLPTGQASMFQGMEDLKPWMISGAALTMALGILLLAAGIGLVRRRAWSSKACMIWAGGKMVLVVANSILGYMVQQAQFETMQEMMAQDPSMPAAMPGIMSGVMQVFGGFTILLGILWGWALPVFVLIWFSRGKIKDEVSGWSAGQSDSM